MQVKTSPPPTHVPPFSQGPESHELFWATRCKSLCLDFFLRRSFEFRAETENERPTRVAGAAPPARRAAAQEGVAVVEAGAAVAAGGGVALALA